MMRKRWLQPTHTVDIATSGFQLGRCHQIGGQVGQGGQDEPAFPHSGVGDGEIGLVDELAFDPEDVGVEGAGAPPLGARRGSPWFRGLGSARGGPGVSRR